MEFCGFSFVTVMMISWNYCNKPPWYWKFLRFDQFGQFFRPYFYRQWQFSILSWTCCWWKKSCTTWDVWNLVKSWDNLFFCNVFCTTHRSPWMRRETQMGERHGVSAWVMWANHQNGLHITIWNMKKTQVVQGITLPETNMAPENGWLEEEISFWDGLFSGAMGLC